MAAINIETSSDRELVLTRVFDAPRELVWEAWTSPEHIPHWMLGPEGWSMPKCELDFRAGGKWHFAWKNTNGQEMEMHGVYQEIKAPERVVTTENWVGPYPETINTYEFAEKDGKTVLTITLRYPTKEARDAVMQTGMTKGMELSFKRLEKLVARIPIIIERTLDAPIATVWKAITELDQMKQWYFSQIEAFKPEVGFETRVDVHYEGKDHLHIWKVMEVVPGKKISYSWRYVDQPGDSLVTFELSADGKKTKLKFTHEGLETFQPETNPMMVRGNFVKGWTHFTTALGQFVERK